MNHNRKFQFQLALVLLGLIAAAEAEIDKRQVGSVVDSDDDRQVASTGFTDALQSASKYFQYSHVPAKDHYELGHRRGNSHHFVERHEKAHPHSGEFKTKVRWGDKHGGYGEHLWDYNHAGHNQDGGENGEETQLNEEHAAAPYEQSGRSKRSESDQVEFIDDLARALAESGVASKHGGNYVAAAEREKREGGEVENFEDGDGDFGVYPWTMFDSERFH